MLLPATNTVDKQDVQLREEDETQWVASGVVRWSAVTAQQQGSGCYSILAMMTLDVNRGESGLFRHVYDSSNTSKSIGIEAALADQC